MKKPFLLLALLVALAMPLVANAQKAGVYYLLNGGGTNATVAAASTNSLNPALFASQPPVNGIPAAGPVIPTQEYDSIGLTVRCTPVGSATESVTFRFSKSADGGLTFETKASISITNTLSGSGEALSFSLASVPGASHLALVSVECPGSVGVSNIIVSANLKSPKYGARQTSQ